MFRTAISKSSKIANASRTSTTSTPRSLSPLIFQPETPKVVLSEEQRNKEKTGKEAVRGEKSRSRSCKVEGELVTSATKWTDMGGKKNGEQSTDATVEGSGDGGVSGRTGGGNMEVGGDKGGITICVPICILM
jgi:hypothetical protein